MSHGIPLAKKVHASVGGEVVVIGLHSVFEHHEAMNSGVARGFPALPGHLPVAVDRPEGTGYAGDDADLFVGHAVVAGDRQVRDVARERFLVLSTGWPWGAARSAPLPSPIPGVRSLVEIVVGLNAGDATLSRGGSQGGAGVVAAVCLDEGP